ncbi:NADH-quinone oxidoreductase subunit G [Pseudonocardia spinosispora]|uniref:NADH-quinone oxidoreductase subunit G n=1 Tax=Pseudonocardia spinosispora TaxID=103441 RepID=UPI00041DD9C5|nr:NADH-quinone oxidoreductase subunit G [Pseudonocardia spinosispora]
MTLTQDTNTESKPVPEGHVRLTIDGIEVDAPKGEILIRTCERLGIIVPRFCDHPLLEPAGACRQCLVEVEMGGRPMPKPQASCTMTVSDGMVVKTQHTSKVADKAQQGVMELLLINHPLDCPICDKGGECPLQNQAMSNGRDDSRFIDRKRTFPKPLAISTQVLLDRERCVLCQRCTRFSDEIAGDPFIELLERGANQQIGVAQDKPFQSYFSGNTIQICPVGALTSAAYRFRSRPFDLVSTPSVCEHCSSGCAQRNDTRRGTVLRRQAGNDPEVNEEWNCDRGRFSFRYITSDKRILRPLVRKNGALVEASWTDALRIAAEGLLTARAGEYAIEPTELGDAEADAPKHSAPANPPKGIGVLAGGRLTVEDAYAYAKFARLAARTNDVDFRLGDGGAEELDFLATHVVGATPETGGLTFTELEHAPAALVVGLDPEEEAGIVFLRLRKAMRHRGLRVFHLGQWTTPSVAKTDATLIPAVPGDEPTVLAELGTDVLDLLGQDGATILVGSRAADVPGLYAAVSALAERTGAKVAWIPARAGDRGALDVGAVPTLLPGGRSVTDAAARGVVAAAWGVDDLPSEPGRSTVEMLNAAAAGELAGLVVGGLDPYDLPNPELALAALRAARFVVSLELQESAVTELADVVLPIAPDVNREGSYLNWEGRRRDFGITLREPGMLPDCRVLDTLAVEMDVDIFTQTPAASAAEIAKLGLVGATQPVSDAAAHRRPSHSRPELGEAQAVLASWRQLLDISSLGIDEPHLAGTARVPEVRVNGATAQRLGITEGEAAVVATENGAISLPVRLADLPDGVVWLPANSPGSRVRATLGAGHGDLVTVSAGGN